MSKEIKELFIPDEFLSDRKEELIDQRLVELFGKPLKEVQPDQWIVNNELVRDIIKDIENKVGWNRENWDKILQNPINASIMHKKSYQLQTSIYGVYIFHIPSCSGLTSSISYDKVEHICELFKFMQALNNLEENNENS